MTQKEFEVFKESFKMAIAQRNEAYKEFQDALVKCNSCAIEHHRTSCNACPIKERCISIVLRDVMKQQLDNKDISISVFVQVYKHDILDYMERGINA